MPGRIGKIARRFAPAFFLVVLSFTSSAQVDLDKLPKPTGYVSDLAQVIEPSDKESLEALCTQVEQQLDAQFAVITISKLGDEPIRDFALQLGRKLGVGPQGDKQGLVIVISLDHHADIEVGRHLEPYISDGFAGDVRRAMTPDLRAGQFGQALIGAVRTLATHLAEQKGLSFSGQVRRVPTEHRRSRGIPGWAILLGIFFIFWLIGRGGRGGGYRGGYGGGGGGGFLTGILLGNLLGGGRRDWGSGGWGNGGGGGFGGGSDGGGGFGGFGGGGDFGGGGSSGNW